MKGLNKLALVSAIALAPFAAQAELKSLDDASMGEMTGQAGVTIELATLVQIGEFTYTDEGTFAVTGITIGGANGVLPGTTALLDDLYIDIDVLADGDALISLHSISGNPIDWGVSFASASLRGTGGENLTVMSNFSAIGYLAQLDIRVDTTGNDSTFTGVGSSAGVLKIDTLFSVENMQMDVPFLAVGIRGLTVHGAGWAGIGQNASPLSRFASLNMQMGTGTSSRVTGDVLQIDVAAFNADIAIAGVIVGGTSIGSIGFDNLSITNTSLKVYGH